MSSPSVCVAVLALLAPGIAFAQEPAAPERLEAEAPGEAIPVYPNDPAGSLEDAIGNSVAMAAANAVYAQQQANVSYQAATTIGVAEQMTPVPPSPEMPAFPEQVGQ